jgi:hypothetical protein
MERFLFLGKAGYSFGSRDQPVRPSSDKILLPRGAFRCDCAAAISDCFRMREKFLSLEQRLRLQKFFSILCVAYKSVNSAANVLC